MMKNRPFSVTKCFDVIKSFAIVMIVLMATVFVAQPALITSQPDLTTGRPVQITARPALITEVFADLSLVVDEADLLTPEEEADLESKLQDIKSAQGLDLVVLTVNSLEGKSVAAYADDFYDSNGYGVGEEHDGVILLVAMGEREYTITTCGYGITAFTDYGLYELEDEIVPYLSAGEYARAFDIFAETGEDYIIQAKNGRPYDDYSQPAPPGASPTPGSPGAESQPEQNASFPWGTRAGVSGIIGVIVSFIATRGMKGELKTVRAVNNANYYIRPEDKMVMNSVKDRDIYLYTNTVMLPIAQPQNHDHGPGMGSTIHMSSAGIPHGGGHHGKF